MFGLELKTLFLIFLILIGFKIMVGIFYKPLTFNHSFRYNFNRFFEKECGNSSVVEHDLAKVGAAGSIPVSRSIT